MNTVTLIEKTSNNFGDQIIRVWVNGEAETHIFQEGSHVNLTTFLAELTGTPHKPFVYHTDPGHGWLAVKRKLLKELGVADKITAYSYQSKSGQTIYLEEDGDAQRFIQAYKLKYGVEPQTVDSYRDYYSPVRSYPGYEA